MCRYMISGQILDGKNILEAVGLLQDGDTPIIGRVDYYNSGATFGSYHIISDAGVVLITNNSSHGGNFTIYDDLEANPYINVLIFGRNSSNALQSLFHWKIGVLHGQKSRTINPYEIWIMFID